MEIKELQKVLFEKGDILTITLDRPISNQQMDMIRESVDKALVKTGLEPGDVTILIFETGAKLELWKSEKLK
jgi:hypothetical protein